MANNRNLPSRRDPVLLPAPAKSPFDQGEDGAGNGGSGSGRQGKRAKVTPVACSPCQKRKSKCDGRRPICSSCEQKGRNDCFYDSLNDLRRTSALKQRIDGLQSEIHDLRDILLALCNAHNSGQSNSALTLVHNTIGSGDWSRTTDLAQVFRTSANEALLSRQQGHLQRPAANMHDPAHAYIPSQGIGQPTYVDQYPHAEQDGVAMSPMASNQPDWSMRGVPEVDGEPDMQGYPANYPYR